MPEMELLDRDFKRKLSNIEKAVIRFVLVTLTFNFLDISDFFV